MTDFRQEQFDHFALAYPALNISAVFKQVPEDFVVDEQLPFELSGEGEHAWLHVRKSNNNTDWVAARIAEYAAVMSPATSTVVYLSAPSSTPAILIAASVTVAMMITLKKTPRYSARKPLRKAAGFPE